jgi:hypothetical protein
MIFLRAILLITAFSPTCLVAQTPIKLAEVEEGLPDISAEEPMAAAYSANRVADVSRSVCAELAEDQELCDVSYESVLHGSAPGTGGDLAGLR